MKTVFYNYNINIQLHVFSNDDFTITNCDAYGKHVFKSQPEDWAHNEEYQTIATTDNVYDTVTSHETAWVQGYHYNWYWVWGYH